MKNETSVTIPAELPPRRLTRPGRRGAQLDFALPSAPAPARRPQRPAQPPTCTRDRAQWWFAQMRRVVEEGRDFNAAGVF